MHEKALFFYSLEPLLLRHSNSTMTQKKERKKEKSRVLLRRERERRPPCCVVWRIIITLHPSYTRRRGLYSERKTREPFFFSSVFVWESGRKKSRQNFITGKKRRGKTLTDKGGGRVELICVTVASSPIFLHLALFFFLLQSPFYM